ncbi:hypothetical protein CR152_01475 [Massilia violaceinigra]|uniref:Uncharacterized protein n=1 Tax=Massilia violaceinigra TaxID=2045208 RepID=A0A2D2DED1_9BURK|nr:hypothetical protein [Massilia violaceinigra]ATQ73323.1 hypothetical protein CR152_01475 [Massilia violaceinigra]
MTVLKSRFKSVTVLSGKTPMLGATAEEWDKALTGNMRESLVEVKRRANSGVKRDVSQATSFDVASFVAKQIRPL